MITKTVYTPSQGHWTLPKVFQAISYKTALACTGICLASLYALNTYQGNSFTLTDLTASLVIGITGTVINAAKNVLASPESTTSGYLRWTNIWADAAERKLIGSGKKEILVVGPGKRQFGDREHCPQMAEALKLWGDNDSSFTVFDSNQSVLDAVHSIHHAESRAFISQTFKQNEALPNANKHALAEVRKRLISEESPSYKLRTRKFRMGSDPLPSGSQPADVIIATFSLFYPMKELMENGKDQSGEKRLQLFGQFLTQLKPGGVMYIDEDCLTALLATPDDVRKHRLKFVITQANISKLKKWIKEAFDLDVDLKHLPQNLGNKKPNGHGMVVQPSITRGIICTTQAVDAYAIALK